MRRNLSPHSSAAFSQGGNENLELLKAWAGTSLAFAIFLAHGKISWQIVTFLVVSAVTCGIGFVLHELAHRVLARRYDAEAHFAANNEWLFISIIIAFLGVFVAAPGAVWHRGTTTNQQSGMIALAGPATNLVLALLFLPLLLLFGTNHYSLLLFSVGYKINAWLGLFNLIPAGPFDGAKVLRWSRVVFGIAVAIAVVLAFIVPWVIGF